MLNEFGGLMFFSKYGLRAGYHQIKVHKKDIHKIVFQTYNDHFEYLVMMFGLCNAPLIFQECMNQIFNSLLRRYALVFFNDILIYSKIRKDHLEHLEVILEVLLDNSFYNKLSKYAFG